MMQPSDEQIGEDCLADISAEDRTHVVGEAHERVAYGHMLLD